MTDAPDPHGLLPGNDPEEDMALIERAESARTRDEAVFVFRRAGIDLGLAGKAHDYWRHMGEAEDVDSDTRALGCLLLAAMAVVPEGCWYRLEEGGAKPNGAPYGPVAQLARKVKTEFGWGVAFRGYSNAYFPCTALLAAILKAEARHG